MENNPNVNFLADIVYEFIWYSIYYFALGNFFYVTFNTSLQQLKSRLFFTFLCIKKMLGCSIFFLSFFSLQEMKKLLMMFVYLCEFRMPPVIISSVFLFEPVFFYITLFFCDIIIPSLYLKKRNKNNRVACLCVHLTWSNSIDSRLWIFKNLNMISFFFLLSFALYKCASMIGVNPKYVHISSGIEP